MTMEMPWRCNLVFLSSFSWQAVGRRPGEVEKTNILEGQAMVLYIDRRGPEQTCNESLLHSLMS